MSDKKTNDLDTMLKTFEEVKLSDGSSVIIPVIRMGRLGKVKDALMPFAHHLPKAGSTPAKSPISVMQWAFEKPAEANNLIAVLLEKELEFVEDLLPNDFVTLASKSIEVNVDFFIRHLLPSVSSAMGNLAAAFNAARKVGGQTTSSN